MLIGYAKSAGAATLVKLASPVFTFGNTNFFGSTATSSDCILNAVSKLSSTVNAALSDWYGIQAKNPCAGSGALSDVPPLSCVSATPVPSDVVDTSSYP